MALKRKNSPKKQGSFHELLRKSGFKATGSRLAILEVLKQSRHPMSAQEVIDMLRSSPAAKRGHRDVDQVTVYRTLKAFKEKGIIRQVDLRHNHAHYEFADDGGHHHHLICVRCGRIEDVPHGSERTLEATVLRDSRHFAEIRTHALEFYGVCNICAKKGGAARIETHENAPL